MSQDSLTTGANEGYERPSVVVLAQAICMAGCANHKFQGCTWDGLCCMDRLAFEDEARRKLEAI